MQKDPTICRVFLTAKLMEIELWRKIGLHAVTNTTFGHNVIMSELTLRPMTSSEFDAFGVIGLNVFGSNTLARNLYEAAGYQVTSMHMQKELPN